MLTVLSGVQICEPIYEEELWESLSVANMCSALDGPVWDPPLSSLMWLEYERPTGQVLAPEILFVVSFAHVGVYLWHKSQERVFWGQKGRSTKK